MNSSYSDARFFGQPKALRHLVFTEAFERFSHIGMQALLVLYMTKYILLPVNSADVWLLTQLRQLFGGIDGQPLASGIFGAFTALIFASQIAGGIVADRYLGVRRSIMIGCVLLVTGYVLLAFKPTFLVALLSLILGNGMFKSNMATEVGQLYSLHDPRRVDGYQLFFISISAGGIVAALLVGPIGEKLGWQVGFLISAISMAVSTSVFFAESRKLPIVSAMPADRSPTSGLTLKEDERRFPWKLLALIPIIALLVVPNYQIFNAYLIWGDTNFDLRVFGYSIPTTSLVLLTGIASISGAVVCMSFWRWWRKRWDEPSDIVKMLIGALFVLAGTICLVFAAALQPSDGRIGLALPVAFHLLAAIGYAHIGPVGLSMVGRLGPQSAKSTAMGFYYLAFGIGSVLVGVVGAYYSSVSATVFWTVHAGIVGFACLCLSMMWQIGFSNGEVGSEKLEVAATA